MSRSSEHIAEIDRLKGFAILSVVWIHSELLANSAFHRFIIDRAVLIFMVLFGVSSELWWQRECERAPGQVRRRWFVGRLRRILPPYWGMMGAWWLVVVLWHPPEGAVRLSWQLAVASFLGYAPNVGTSWFVTMILQYIAFFPILRRALARFGAPLCLAVAAAATWASGWYMFYIVDAGKYLFGDNIQWPGWFYHWIFAPRAIWHVMVGICVARFWGGRISLSVTLVAVALTAVGFLSIQVARGAPEDVYGPIRALSVAHLVDVPLSIALLGLFRWVPLPAFIQNFLAWCGIWSWGIYLGHLLVHEVIHIAGIRPDKGPELDRAIYSIILLVSGIIVAVVAARLRTQLAGVLSRFRASNPSPSS